MIRIFNVHYQKRTVLLFTVEAVILLASFMLAAVFRLGGDFSGGGYIVAEIVGLALLAQLGMYCCDLYDSQRVSPGSETSFRLFAILGTLSLVLAAVGCLFPSVYPAGGTFVVGLSITTISLFAWRTVYAWFIRTLDLRWRVYMLADGELGSRIGEVIRTRPEMGLKLVGCMASHQELSNRETLKEKLTELAKTHEADGVVVALAERRATLPVQALLELRLSGITVEDGTAFLERISGKIELDQLNPSWLIFSEGFKIGPRYDFSRRVISVAVSMSLLVLLLPLIPLTALLIKITSKGPVLYRQARVGRNGVIFNCYKFRTMRANAEADTGATWASDGDPRITRLGRWLRFSRLDEIPQLWNVLRGDMAFCGPRPERPEFVQWLTQEIPYYLLRHSVRPGITGWAQVNYKYGNSVQDAKEKLKYDLFYIKNASISLDLLICFRTIKTVLLGRGAQ